ncbi:methyltransferase [Mariniflexile litorale]|uniref:Methyltransferase n=1 Tax=Mariniflexile litorale TaxID=3045158 RepID=A0AAU7ECQ9_9FLAO|nr:methyltransferase [Mariniflexile sp. KMM 9835]MDQ8212280.1 methyltransferase [Mariniflexile sp. KMM 9835]
MISNIETNHQITQIWQRFLSFSTSFRNSTILFSALELNIFDFIDKDGSTIEAIASTKNISNISCEQLLNALVSLKYIIFFEGKYYPNEIDSIGYLKTISDVSFRNDLLLQKQENEVWLNLAKIARGEYKVPKSYSSELLENNIMKYKGILNANLNAAGYCLSSVSECIREQKTVLDIGGGDGVHAKVLLAINPQMKLSVLDLPNCFDGCVNNLSEEIEKKQVKLVSGDALALEQDKKYDLVTLNELLEIFSRKDKLNILKSTRKLSSKIIITKFSLHDTGTSPGGGAIFSLRMFVKYPQSYLSTDSEISELLKLAGYDDIIIHRIPNKNKTVIIAGFDNPILTSDTEKNAVTDALGIDKSMLAAWNHHLQNACKFRLSSVFQAAVELKLFSYFKPFIGVSTEVIASEIQVDPLMLSLLLNSYVAMGLLKKIGQDYVATDILEPILSDERRESYLNELLIYQSENKSWLKMTEKLQGLIPKTVSFEDDMIQANTTESYISSIELANKDFVSKLLATISKNLESSESILDIGGGHGFHARSICTRYPNNTVSILDLPSMLEVTKKFCDSFIESGAILLHAGDATKFDLGKTFDVIMMNDILHYFSPDEVQLILTNVKNHLKVDGVLIISDFALDFHKNVSNHIFSIKAHLKTKKGRVHSLQNLMNYLNNLEMDPFEYQEIDNKLILLSKKSIK